MKIKSGLPYKAAMRQSPLGAGVVEGLASLCKSSFASGTQLGKKL